MTRRLTRTPEARRDIIEHAVYLGQQSARTAARFLDAVEASLERLVEMPQLGSPRDFPNPELTGLRSWAVRGFPNVLIFYRLTETGIDVIRVLHGARDLPGIFTPPSAPA